MTRYGHVNHANYLRYMQESALDASAAVGYDEARYHAAGHIWLIRETNIEYLRPLRFGDSVEVTTWVGDFRRVRSRRFYELRSAASGELVAKASTDWVYIERETGRPARVPPEMVAAFAPEGIPKTAAARDPFPAAPAAAAGRVHDAADGRMARHRQAQHVNNATYLNYMEECGIQAAKSFGWSMANGCSSEGFAIVARAAPHRVPPAGGAGRRPARSRPTFPNLRRASATRHYLITRVEDGELIAQARSLWVFVNLASGGIIRLPAVVPRTISARHTRRRKSTKIRK